MSCLNVLRVFDQLFDVCTYSLWSPLNIPGTETSSRVSFRVIHTASPTKHSCEKELIANPNPKLNPPRILPKNRLPGFTSGLHFRLVRRTGAQAWPRSSCTHCTWSSEASCARAHVTATTRPAGRRFGRCSFVVPLGRTACLLRARLRTRRAWSSYGYLSNVLSKERRRSAVGMQQVRCHPRSRCSSLTCYQRDLTCQPDSMLRADAPVPTAFRSNMIPRLSPASAHGVHLRLYFLADLSPAHGVHHERRLRRAITMIGLRIMVCVCCSSL
jgi:hypothetical protein